MTLIVKNGRVIDPAQQLDTIADVLISDGNIRTIGQNLTAPGADLFDATGCVVAPGFYDIHVHLREPGFEDSETIASGAQCALVGGFTTICCMP